MIVRRPVSSLHSVPCIRHTCDLCPWPTLHRLVLSVLYFTSQCSIQHAPLLLKAEVYCVFIHCKNTTIITGTACVCSATFHTAVWNSCKGLAILYSKQNKNRQSKQQCVSRGWIIIRLILFVPCFTLVTSQVVRTLSIKTFSNLNNCKVITVIT